MLKSEFANRVDSRFCVGWWVPSFLLPPSMSAQIASSWNEVPANQKTCKVEKTILQEDLCQLHYIKNSVAPALWKSAVFVHAFSYIFCWVLPNVFWYLTNLIAIFSIVEVAENFYITWTNSSRSVLSVDLFCKYYSSPAVFAIYLDDWWQAN